MKLTLDYEACCTLIPAGCMGQGLGDEPLS